MKAKRGHRTTTYDIETIVAVDPTALTLTLRHAGAHRPDAVTLRAPVTTAAQQLLDAMARSLAIHPEADADSRWNSFGTVEKAAWFGGHILTALTERGIETFADERITVPLLRELYQPFNSSIRRSACWLLARTVRTHHPDGRALAHALKNTRFQVEDTEPFSYDTETAAAIEKAARQVWTDAYRAQRDLMSAIGHDVTGRGWLEVPAEDVVAWAHQTYRELATSHAEPTATVPLAGQIAWALTHPERFGYRKGVRRPPVARHTLNQIGRALYPDNATLTAALVVHCLAEHAGYNVSVLMEKSTDSLIHIGDDEALEYAVKARASSEERRPTRLDSLYSSGGVVQTLAGLTRFSRRYRAVNLATGSHRSSVIDRLYVEHTADPTIARVLTSERIQHAWRSTPLKKAWSTIAGPAEYPPLRISALRLEVQRRLLDHGLSADVHGHTEATKTHYLAHVLPDHVLNKEAVAAQNAFHDSAIAQFRVVADASDGPAANLAATDPTQLLDVEIGVCTNAGNAPGSDRRCGLGIVACFTCPNGYRTVDHLPGLLGAVEFADIVEANDPDEWEHGQASELRYYAQACLDAFPAPVVTNVRRTTDLTPHILTVTGMYMEMRHG